MSYNLRARKKCLKCCGILAAREFYYDVVIESIKYKSQTSNVFVFALPVKGMQAKTGGH
jgi:hypothetical protein